MAEEGKVAFMRNVWASSINIRAPLNDLRLWTEFTNGATQYLTYF